MVSVDHQAFPHKDKYPEIKPDRWEYVIQRLDILSRNQSHDISYDIAQFYLEMYPDVICPQKITEAITTGGKVWSLVHLYGLQLMGHYGKDMYNYSLDEQIKNINKVCEKCKDNAFRNKVIKAVQNNAHIEGENTIVKQLKKQLADNQMQIMALKNNRKEDYYQKLLEKVLGGTHKVLPHGGVTDITTDQLHAEIKTWKDHKTALGQILQYNRDCPRQELHIYFFGKEIDKEYAKWIADGNKQFGINTYSLRCQHVKNKHDIITCVDLYSDTEMWNAKIHIR